MERQERWSQAKQGEQGPTWREVLSYWESLQREFGHSLTLGAQMVKASNGSLGMRGVIGCPCSPTPYASFSYGNAFASSPKTLPAALYRALLEVDEALGAIREAEGGKSLWEDYQDRNR